MNPTSVEIIAPVLTEAVAEEGAPLDHWEQIVYHDLIEGYLY